VSVSFKTFSVNQSLQVDVRNDTSPATGEDQNSALWPSLRGRYLVENGVVLCRGVWAMNDNAHGVPGQTSDFEFRLVSTDVDRSILPVSGKYVGWFMLKQLQKNSVKVDDREMNINFKKMESGNEYSISGDGVNKFGKFTLKGTLSADSMIHMFKKYIPKKGATPRGARPASTRSSSGGSHRPRSRPSTVPVPASPRESSTRQRRPSVVVQEAEESRSPSSPMPAAAAVPVTAPSMVKRQSSGHLSRPTRPPAFVSKCREVLKEMSKQHLGIYFSEPVDFVKLGIPDYPTIIKEPMDFSTIGQNLEQNVYSSHEEFAQHMRLVFRNAITYNVRRDNPVHMAAREMSDIFEERYRIMVSQLGVHSLPVDYEVGLSSLRTSSGAINKKGKGKKGRASTVPPRAVDSVPGAAALDSSMQTMKMMQQKMLEMEEEINNLRTAVRQSDIRATLGQQMVAAQAPLTYEEKKILIANIMKLDGDQMTSVVDIIQSAMPHTACGDGDEVEIPVDELDTYTLRQLQDYVQSVFSAKSRKRAPATSPAVRGGGAPKRSRTSSSSSLPPPASAVSDSNTSSFFADVAVSSRATDIEYKGPSPTLMDGSRKRSNSLDLFPSDEIGADTGDDESGYNPSAWASDSLVESREQIQKQKESLTETWGDAVTERSDHVQRDAALKAEAAKLSEQRAKAESERQVAMELALQRRATTSENVGDRSRQLEQLREAERASRERMEPTVELNDAHSALFDHESFGL